MNTERTEPGTQRQLAAIAEVAALGIPVWLRGGWAMDFFLGYVSRPHRDVDWFAWAADADRIAAALTDASVPPVLAEELVALRKCSAPEVGGLEVV
ncbi:hypothetical protein ACTI_71260 [Actinoplanes sp. OR16]|uniref:nucleotidyltransferase domain-containing protein n=1 Tax=Actinoplanes sp. OR16 TaxID=946334 RepID=UPI000F70CF03|nr:hypothetical protein [Actinoplanes sp. OR16]BBH70441.1 hypothetical protein ACTI_71260 [Actinoplanes sp. OR16]